MRLAKTTLTVILLLSSRSTTAAEPAEQPQKSFDEEVRSVDLAIKHFMRSEPGKSMSRDPVVRIDMAKAIVEASQTHGIPPLLLTTIVYNESTFDTAARGKLGEIGLTQVHGVAARNCDLATVSGQLECGAKWLSHYYPVCKTWEKSLTAYATRGFCVSTSPRTRDKIAHRMRQWKKIEKEVEALSATDYGG